ncbi:JAB domain-containing protein [Reichenbachiella sp.]|uniref:JAB domain-containing protein n=1 Tax=Reichenbachiella sp. TaxID=2184521 RepID=UPI003BB069D8
MESSSFKTYKKVVAEIQATYNPKNQAQAIKVSSSQAVNQYIRKVYPVDIEMREAFMCLYLNRANNVQGFAVISIGGLSGTVADPKTIFQHALLCNAAHIIMIHNHPSGNTQPSQQDINLTRKVKSVGEAMDLPVLDHVILTKESFFSFADECLL